MGMSDGLHIQIFDLEGDPLSHIPSESLASLWKKGAEFVFDVNHATERVVSVSVKQPKVADFPSYWEMRWNGDDEYLPRPQRRRTSRRQTAQAVRDSEAKAGESRESG